MGWIKRKKGFEYNGKWFSIWNRDWTFKLTYDKCGYFNSHPEIHICVLGIHMVFRMPWKDEKWAHECDSPRWGIWICDGVVFIEHGGKGNWGGNKTKSFDLPFFTWKHMCHLVETKDGKMTDSKELGSENPYIFYGDDEKVRKHDRIYVDPYDGEKVNCHFWKEYREWRPKWLTWTSLFAKKRNYIEIEFDNEVGSRKGSWKGGVMGTSYDMKPHESAVECFERMQKEKVFN